MKKLLLVVFVNGSMVVNAQQQIGYFRTPPDNTQYHQFTRVGGGGAAVYINQTDATSPILRLSSKTSVANAGVVLTVENSGNVGIGTIMPTQKLTVAGNINFDSPTSGSYLGFGNVGNNEYNTIGSMYSGAGLVLAHGLKPSSVTNKMVYSHPAIGRSAILMGSGFHSGGIKFYTKPSATETVGGDFNDDPRMIIADNGNVGIGTSTPAEKLSVNGNIRAKEVKIETANWPDYVFDSSYQLKPLAEVEKFIEANKRLPDVPSASVVAKEGIELGSNQALLLKKIEELTLHLININKRVEQLETENKFLKKDGTKSSSTIN